MSSVAATSSSYSYTEPIDISVISEHLATATNSILIQLVSEFELAKGTSALISLALVYGLDFLQGTLTDISSLALNVATVSGKNDDKNSVVTALDVPSVAILTTAANSTAVATSSAPSTLLTSTLGSHIALETAAASSLSASSASTGNATSSAGGARLASTVGFPFLVLGGALALI